MKNTKASLWIRPHLLCGIHPLYHHVYVQFVQYSVLLNLFLSVALLTFDSFNCCFISLSLNWFEFFIQLLFVLLCVSSV